MVGDEHFRSIIAEKAIFELPYAISGFAKRIEDCDKLMDWFVGHSTALYAADNLRIHNESKPVIQWDAVY